MSNLVEWLISFGLILGIVGVIILWYLQSLWHSGILVEGRIRVMNENTVEVAQMSNKRIKWGA